jgi:hypothetical protein
MSIFDRFTSKPRPPKGYKEVEMDFTVEEAEAINRGLKMYAEIANADAPEGMTAIVSKKFKDAITAKVLNEYVEDLMQRLRHCSEEETLVVMHKAIQAQMKVYAIHNLPVYLFQVAGMFEYLGDTAKAKEFFQLFLRTQSDFKPDKIDAYFLNQTGFDIAKTVSTARQKLIS